MRSSLNGDADQLGLDAVNLRDIWRESLHGIWRMFNLPEEGKCAVQRSSLDDFIATAGVRGTYLNPTDHAK